MSEFLGNPIAQALDGESNPVEFDIAYPVKHELGAALRAIQDLHGDAICLLPMSATSSGGGIFQLRTKPSGKVVGLRFDAPADPQIREAPVAQLNEVRLDEIVIDRENWEICAGAAITLEQLNLALTHILGQGFKVPGADLTSYQYAAVGATFMTGGMGPQRRYFSDSVLEIALHHRNGVEMLSGESLTGFAGTYGWTGIVSAVRCRYRQFPSNEIAFALPVSDDPAELAGLLAHLAPYCFLDLGSRRAVTEAGGHDMILGIEQVSHASMQPLLNLQRDNPSWSRARDLEQKIEAASADGLLFINGFSDDSIDEFLIRLTDDPQAEDFTIAGIDLEFAEIFADPNEMRAVREAIPYSARTQTPPGRLVYKNHADANIKLTPPAVETKAAEIWRINNEYVSRVRHHFDQTAEVDGEILVYGHLNPCGVDPHNRVTMGSDNADAFESSRDYLIQQRAWFYRALAALCESGEAEFIGGEKTADSELGIYRALGGPEKAPAALRRKFERQQAMIRAADRRFSWRAPAPYI